MNRKIRLHHVDETLRADVPRRPKAFVDEGKIVYLGPMKLQPIIITGPAGGRDTIGSIETLMELSILLRG